MAYKKQFFNNKLQAFTIVELLVVIVVIGVLAAITIVSYSGVSQRATLASLQSDLKNASTQLKVFHINNDTYPNTISTNCSTNPDSETNGCLAASSGTTYTYKLSSSNNNIYCLTATKNFISYNITQDSQILAGSCPVFNVDASNILSYPGSGVYWHDLSGNDNNGTMYGGVLYSATDNSMSFDGLDDYIDTKVAPSVISPIFSGSFWASRIGTPGNDTDIPRRLITARKGYCSTLWAIGIGGSNQLKLMAFDGATHIYENGSILNEDIIYNIQFSYDDSVFRVYKNGVIDIELTISIPDLSYQTILIGDLDPANRRLWRGKIYSAQFGDYAMSEQEVVYNYNSIKARYGL